MAVSEGFATCYPRVPGRRRGRRYGYRRRAVVCSAAPPWC